MRIESYIFEETKPNQFNGDDAFPTPYEDGKIYICQEYNLAAYLCPCGCREKIFLKINEPIPNHPHSWTFDGSSFSPSINQTITDCKSHYFIKSGKVIWA